MQRRLPLAALAALAAITGLSTAGATAGTGAKLSGYAPGKPVEYVLPGAQVFPEGIGTLPGTKAFFVSSTTDGTIFRGDTRRPGTRVFAPGGADGRTTAVGLKADRRGHLVVAGGATGKIFVLSTRDGSTVKVLDTQPGAEATFLNDVVISGGYAYVTDSNRPKLFRVALHRDGSVGELETFVDFTGSAFAYQPGFNANGIVATRDGRFLVIVQSGTGKLFRVDTRTKAVREVDLGGASVPNGDGLLLVGRTLYVAQNMQELITPVTLTRNAGAGVVGTGTTGPQLKYPTTLARDGRRLLAVNSQFDKRGPGLVPELPFSVVAVAAPPAPRR